MKKEKAKVKDKQETEIDKTEEMIPKEDAEKAQTIVEREMAKKKVPRQVSQEILKKIFKNLILAIVVMIYFIACNIVYTKLEMNQMEMITKAVSGVFLLASIILFEFAYKKDSGTLTMTALELLVLSIHALFINHVITIYQFDFRAYLLTSSCIFATYYVLKSIVIYTRDRIKYLKSLSDISEIVKDEPVVKEAKKRKEEPDTDIKEKTKVEKDEKQAKSIKEKTKKPKSTGKKIENETSEEGKKKK